MVLDIETLQASRQDWEQLVEVTEVTGSDGKDIFSTNIFDYSEHEARHQKEGEVYQRFAFDGTFSRIVVIGLLVFSEGMVP